MAAKGQHEAAGALVTIGVDTHSDVHVAVALDQVGRNLGTLSIPTTRAGYRRLLEWGRSLGTVARFGLEGTGSYGAGLTRHLREAGIDVVEVIRPSRQNRRLGGKTGTLDAEAAARSALAGTELGQSKAQDGAVEMIRTMRVARRSAMKARTQAASQLRAVIVTAPDALRERLRSLPADKLVAAALRFRPGQPDDLEAAGKLTLKCLAARYRHLDEEITALDVPIGRLARQVAPALTAIKGVGAGTAAALLTAAGDNPGRLHSEAAFAHMCGVAPIPVSSGKTSRHRCNPGGNREANRALYMLAVRRLSYDQRSQDYAARRTAEGKTRREIVRCLKRYLARDIFKALTRDNITKQAIGTAARTRAA